MVIRLLSHGEGLKIDYIKNYQFKKFYQEVKGTSNRFNKNMILIIIGELLEIYPDFFKWRFLLKNTNSNEQKILNKEFARKINLDFKIESFSNNKLRISEKAREFHFNMINSGQIQHTFEETDKISAAFNIEPRYPFFDVRLMEFCLAIPSEQKRKYGWDRFVLRQSMTNILPKEIQWRKTKKTGINSNINNFINFDKDFIENLICNNNKVIQDYIDISIIQDIYQKFKNNQDYQDAQDFFDLWKFVSLGLWMNHSSLYTKTYN